MSIINSNNEYKLSYFNFYIPVKETDEWLLYNSLYQKIFITRSNVGNILKQLDQDFDSNILNKKDLNLDKEIKQKLIDERFLIPVDSNEYEILQNRWTEIRKTKSRRLFLVILPSNNCNMSCLYCFESDRNPTNKMKDYTMNQILEFLENAIIFEKLNINELSVIWFGGEPLIYPEGIDKLSQGFLTLCKRYHLKYTSRLFTNGYLLSTKNWNILMRNSIRNIDITIDGNKDTHSLNRPLKTGNDSYHKILENLTHLPPGIKVLIRINVDKKVYEKIEDLFYDLNAYRLWPQKHPYISLYLGFKRYYDFNGQKLIKSDFFTLKEFAEIKEDFRELKQKLYNNWATKNNVRNAKLAWRFPEMNPFYCESINSPYGFVINADGYVGKCWNHSLDPQRMIFHIKDGYKAIVNNKAFKQLCSFLQPEYDDVCRTCKYLPICDKGYCYDFHIVKCLPRPCTTWKCNLKEVLKKQYLLSLEKPDQIQSIENLCKTFKIEKKDENSSH